MCVYTLTARLLTHMLSHCDIDLCMRNPSVLFTDGVASIYTCTPCDSVCIEVGWYTCGEKWNSEFFISAM